MSRRGEVLRTALSLALLTLVGGGCTAVPEGLEPVRPFDIGRYLGIWYEIARLDHRFERGLEDVSATYSRGEDGGIRVVNRGWDPEAQQWREAVGRAYPLDDPKVGSLKVSFFGPFYGGYHVIALDPAYQTALVTGPDRSYLWILSRNRRLDPNRKRELVDFAREKGFDVDALQWIPQTRSDPALGSST